MTEKYSDVSEEAELNINPDFMGLFMDELNNINKVDLKPKEIITNEPKNSKLKDGKKEFDISMSKNEILVLKKIIDYFSAIKMISSFLFLKTI